MSVQIRQFWDLLAASGLLTEAQVKELATPAPTLTAADSLSQLVDQLVSDGQLTQYQADVLANGQASNFLFGNYRIVDRWSAGNPNQEFSAVHRSGRRVKVQFVPGSQSGDRLRWTLIRQRAELLIDCQYQFLAACFETVKLPEHRMVVSELPAGKPLSSFLTSKARMPWSEAQGIAMQIALALDHLHRGEVAHRSLCPSSVWLMNAETTRLHADPLCVDARWFDPRSPAANAELKKYTADEFQQPASDVTRASLADEFSGDMYALGAILFRLTVGREVGEVAAAQRSQLFAKKSLPDWFGQSVLQLVNPLPERRPSASQLVDLFSEHGVRQPIDRDRPDPRMEFRQALSQPLQLPAKPIQWDVPTGLGEPAAMVVEPVSIVAQQIGHQEESTAPTDTDQRIARAKANLRRQRTMKWMQPLIVMASCLLVGGLFAGIYFWGDSFPASNPTNPVNRVGTNQKPTSNRPIFAANSDPTDNAAQVPPVQQQLVANDGDAIWETPTLGEKLEFEYLPPAPKIIVSARPQKLLAIAEGQRLRLAMGPGFNAILDSFQQRIGLPLEQVDQLVLSYHQGQQDDYQLFAVVTCRGIDRQKLKAAWGELTEQKTFDGDLIYKTDDRIGYFFIDEPSQSKTTLDDSELNDSEGSGSATDNLNQEDVAADRPTNPDSDSVCFLAGPVDLLQSVVEIGGGFPVAGSIDRVRQFTDRQRHLNIVYLRSALFNDRGQNWMGPPLAGLNRQLSEWMPDEVNGGLASVHIDPATGAYFEWMFDRSVDIKAAELENRLVDGIADRLPLLYDLNQQIPPDEHWQAVQQRYRTMVVRSIQQLRWGTEDGELWANAWLPTTAGHNLIAATELITTYQSTAVDSERQAIDSPQSLTELLKQKRDLDIANPPDLNALMSELQTEIDSDYSGLPFEWRIVLLGADLEKNGITKNQRPGPLKLEQTSLAEILTSIMVSANPDKNISGPQDPGCKLIWVVARDPDFADREAILITTRDAAKEKNYQIPPAFATD